MEQGRLERVRHSKNPNLLRAQPTHYQTLSKNEQIGVGPCLKMTQCYPYFPSWDYPSNLLIAQVARHFPST